MPVANVTLLHKHLVRHSLVVLDIADQQVKYLYDKRYGDAIETGDFWLRTYMHVPHAMLFDLWSAVAELRLRRKKYAILRLIRADQTFRMWERAVQAQNIELTEGERDVIFGLIEDFREGLLYAFPERTRDGLFEIFYHEYLDRALDTYY